MESVDLVTAYRDALVEAGFGANLLGIPSGRRRKTDSRESFEVFAQLQAAPAVAAVIERFVEQAGLWGRDDFSVSCLPQGRKTSAGVRATVVALGQVEILVVDIDPVKGVVSRVRIWGEPDADRGWLRSFPEVRVGHSDLDGGGIELELPSDHALDLLASPDIRRVIVGRVVAMKKRKRRSRRKDWHNPWLWALVDSGVASPSSSEEVISGEWDVSTADALRIVRQRTSQAAFRKRLLESSPQLCAICGINVPEVLEAAHLVPHARGGAASAENGRLLCANHHRAFDARLYRWTGEKFVWAGVGEEPPLGGRQP